MSKVIKLIKNSAGTTYFGELDNIHMQYGYHYGKNCNYLEVCLIKAKKDSLFQHFREYDELFYLLDNKETILEQTITRLKDHNLFIDEIQLLTETDVAFDEIILDE